ncbi:non-hydrolyzing UDP-N-acetylglucosamine 2-epimerase [Hyphomicrobium zavarzinii]|uniref:non-hydrolyzing UDP-N-acetylglucosamine 2-epimerase n=1 Tax=Hyphomicrobium zavarzinii TaxID=48292 RepID=UPI0003A973F1|nr:UDP-N-acetylglucosamine 2-epimerase (non-hydrolyzing) [Hyphomicrobium zavarzinii]
MKVAVVLGTRPEAIKLAPVILSLRKMHNLATLVVNSGQHRELSVKALSAFGIVPDIDLTIMQPGQTIAELTSRLFASLDRMLDTERPDWVIVQGDTSTAMVAAVTAFYRRIKVAHVEAGLRSFDIWAPFPEEANRVFVSHVATHSFAPTALSRDNLLRLGVDESAITVTGNTVVDALRLLRPGLNGIELDAALGPAVMADLEVYTPILVTSHRRESFGAGLDGICTALSEIAARFEDHAIIYPVHPNPNVREFVVQRLGGRPRIHLVEPLGYLELLAVMNRSTLILTDSGGIQEEAPSFGKPVLILRDVTERPEVVEVGAGRLVGTDAQRIVAGTVELLSDAVAYARMARAGNPFGDGFAAERIVDAITASA